MKKLLLISIILFSQFGLARTDKLWMGTWVSKKLICPFKCSQIMHGLFEKSKTKKFQFTLTTIVDASGMSANCLPPSRPDYTGLKAVTAKKYLADWSQNEEANQSPKIKDNLPKILGLSPNQEITAGVIHCFAEDGNLTASNQNIIFVHAKRALARFEENAYFELTR